MKKCPECGEVLGNEAVKCFNCDLDVSDVQPGQGIEGKRWMLPYINIWIILVCIVWPMLAIIFGCCGLIGKDPRAREYISMGFKIIGIEIIVNIVGTIMFLMIYIR